MKRVYRGLFWTTAVIQCVATIAVIMGRFLLGMSRLRAGGTAPSFEHTLRSAEHVLLFPMKSVGVYTWFQLYLQGTFGWLPIVFNSLLWAAFITGIIMLITKARRSPIGIRTPLD